MIIASINALSFGSTGNIMLDISKIAQGKGHECYTFSKPAKDDTNLPKSHIYIGTENSVANTARLSVYSGLDGVFCRRATKALVKKLRLIKPDIIHLHNLHGWFINYPMLFNYVKENNVKIVWTLHDCWAFTGHCPHFEMIKCEKWKNGCFGCAQYREYPQSKIDTSKLMYKLKKKWFTGVDNLTIVTPSHWLKNLVNESFLKDYPVKVIHNGIDLSVFKPTPSQFRNKYNIGNKKIVLGVSFGWDEHKGIDVFIKLASLLDDNYQIVLVGTDETVDKLLPENIISIYRTQNQAELAEIYTAADVFVNPTREEVLGLVNIEALATGTPVITFNSGGSPECIDKTCGVVVPKNDIDKLISEINRICKDNPYTQEDCINRAKLFDRNEKFNDYLTLFEGIVNDKKQNC